MLSTDQLDRPEVAELLNELAESAPAVTKLLRSLRVLADDGSLDLIAELLGFVKAIRDSAGPSMMSTVAAQGVRIALLADDLFAASWIDELPDVLAAVEDELTQHKDQADKGRNPSLWQVMRLARDPQTLRAMHFLLSVLKRSASSELPDGGGVLVRPS